MKYCSHCGTEVVDEAVVCPSCGCKIASTNTNTIIEEDDKKIFAQIIKILMIICCVVSGFALIPLIWTLPMTLHACCKLDRGEPMSVVFKVCVLLFVSRIAGIMLLCMDLDKDL